MKMGWLKGCENGLIMVNFTLITPPKK